ncbi:D-hexose-6-phosphate mutarotase [Psychromonas antarctica]|uniref:D-hexose-6-phosphate mutarotase n=1 Tax=Psychromonas antarctica TaxID=67573 RepID=UPI001EE7E8C2|nr:D-hexose-6-phosphate mutarotase [Psychromonas antarctica]MCG6201572.1 D-hexose-6-phosphate mutarotase [Psychromonas antarctica]
MISHLTLQNKQILTNTVSLQVDAQGHEFLIIAHENFNAAFALHGAHLLHFQLKGQPPLIWLSKTANYDEKKAIRGGVPICWPWFGAADKSLGNDLPAHGFARTSKWSLKNINELTHGLEIELLLKDSLQTRKIWPYPFELTLKATLTDTLKLELISKNSGKKAYLYGAALHTYFNISAPESCLLKGLAEQYQDKLDAGHLRKGEASLQIQGPIDSIYTKASAAIALIDNGFKRQINISNSGNDSDVVWTPWVEGAKAFTDMPDDGYKQMLCVESTITRPEGQIVAPNQVHILSTVIGQS